MHSKLKIWVLTLGIFSSLCSLLSLFFELPCLSLSSTKRLKLSHPRAQLSLFNWSQQFVAARSISDGCWTLARMSTRLFPPRCYNHYGTKNWILISPLIKCSNTHMHVHSLSLFLSLSLSLPHLHTLSHTRINKMPSSLSNTLSHNESISPASLLLFLCLTQIVARIKLSLGMSPLFKIWAEPELLMFRKGLI